MKKTMRVSLLVLILSCSVDAGYIPNGVSAQGEIPNNTTAQGEIPFGMTAQGDIPNAAQDCGDIPNNSTVDGHMPCGGAVPDGLATDVVMSMLRSLVGWF